MGISDLESIHKSLPQSLVMWRSDSTFMNPQIVLKWGICVVSFRAVWVLVFKDTSDGGVRWPTALALADVLLHFRYTLSETIIAYFRNKVMANHCTEIRKPHSEVRTLSPVPFADERTGLMVRGEFPSV
jgi:hypothetical protein